MKIAYSGAPGAFAHEACCAFAEGMEAVAVDGFAAVADAVLGGQAQCGMLPLRNSRAGVVGEAAKLLAGSGLRIVSEHDLAVRMHLLGLPGTDLATIRQVKSHPMALRQCTASISRLGLGTRDAPNTATAARDLRDPSCAVLASQAAAETYGLLILARDLQDDPDNRTRFALVARAEA